MSHLSKPMPSKDHYNCPSSTVIQCPVCPTWSRIFLSLPQLFYPSSNIQEFIRTQLLAIPLQESRFGTQCLLSEPHLKSRTFVLHQWFPLLISPGHLERRNYRINSKYSEKGIIRNSSSCKVLFSNSKNLTCSVSECECFFQNKAVFPESGNSIVKEMVVLL